MLSRIFNRSLLSAIALISNILVFAQQTQQPPTPVVGGAGAVGPGGAPENPIDMYDGILLLVAVSLIIGYYLYKRNRRIASS